MILASEPYCWSATQIGECTLDDLDLMFNPLVKKVPGSIEFDSMESLIEHLKNKKQA